MSFIAHAFYQGLRLSFCLFLTLTISTNTLFAYTYSTIDSGYPIRWRPGQKLFMAGNPSSQQGISADFFRSAVVNGLQQWKWATDGILDFEYWQGTDPQKYEANLSQNGLSSVFFASNSSENADPNVIGYTQVWFNTQTGDMIEADIMLNDRDYDLTANPQDTSSSSNSGWGRKKVYVSNIITHELGHAIGLSHSGNINSSMLYVEFSEQSQIGCDDWAGARHLYTPQTAGTGGLKGFVTSPFGQTVSGAQVTAISQSRGVPLATVHTNSAGQFEFTSLEAGSYALMVEPFRGGTGSVPAQVQAKGEAVCNGSDYPANFFTEADGHTLRTVSVASGSSRDAGTIQLQCQAVTDSQNLYTNTSVPPMIVDRGQIASGKNYRFQANGPFRITGIGYLLMSPIKVDVRVYNADGSVVQTSKSSPLYSSSSNFQIPDTEVTGTAYGEVWVQVIPASLPSGSYPSPSIWPNSTPFFVVTFNESPQANQATRLPANARCVPSEAYAAYASPSGDPVRYSTSRSTRDGIGFCGTAEASSLQKNPADPRSTPPIGAILSWLTPFWAAFLSRWWFRRRRAFDKL